MDIDTFIRPNISALKPYSSARDEYSGSGGVFLDANENPYGRLNRYPDPHHTELRNKLSEIKKISSSEIFIGNGSDEIIDLVFRIFCTPGKDKALTFGPTYGMYKVAADVNDIRLVTLDLDSDFQINRQAFVEELNDTDLKLVIVCSPNNPTGNSIGDIEYVVRNFKGVVLVDEAYIDFSVQESLTGRIGEYQNLIVCQTFSKAFGLAGARVGVAYASDKIIDVLYRVKPPYNVSKPDQKAAIDALNNIAQVREYVIKILSERKRVEKELGKMAFIKKIWPSDANFLLVEVDDATQMYEKLLAEKIIVRNRDSLVRNTIRITIGTPAENTRLLEGLRIAGEGSTQEYAGEYINSDSGTIPWSARIVRTTSETSIVIDLNLKGTGKAMINTGIGFFDHMLYQIARHGDIDLDIDVSGDLHVDQHHTIEDVGLALGEAFDKALGSRAGIERYGFLLPMDDALAQVAVDFGGRSFLMWDVTFRREYLGEMPTELFRHFFRSFTGAARCNLNIKAEGVDEHHKAEAVFKAFARAVRMAIKDNGSQTIPSTKGVL